MIRYDTPTLLLSFLLASTLMVVGTLWQYG